MMLDESLHLAKLVALSNKFHLQAYICHPNDERIRKILDELQHLDFSIIHALSVLRSHPEMATCETRSMIRVAFTMRFELDRQLFNHVAEKSQ